MKINIAIAEDDTFLLSSLIEKLSFFDELHVKFQAANGEELLNHFAKDYNVDVVLMDIQMPVMDGITTTAKLKERHPQVKIIMLTVMDDEQYIFNSIVNGADGYLLKETSPQELYNGIKEILSGGAPMTPSIAFRALKLLRNAPPVESGRKDDFQLTQRETEILQQLSRGLNYKMIAENLFISSGTVRKHLENIYKKLQVHNKVEALNKASSSGII